MSNTMPRGGRRPCTRSIHWPDKSARAERFLSVASHCVSKRPIWLGEAARPTTALPPTIQRIAGSCRKRSASDILVSGKTTEYRLPQQTNQRVAAVLARACIGEHLARHHAQPKSVVEFAVGQQPGIRGDNGAAKLQRQAAIEIEPNSIRY